MREHSDQSMRGAERPPTWRRQPYTHKISTQIWQSEVPRYHHIQILMPSPMADSHFVVLRRVVGWVDRGIAGKGATAHAQSNSKALNPGLSRDVHSRKEVSPSPYPLSHYDYGTQWRTKALIRQMQGQPEHIKTKQKNYKWDWKRIDLMT